MFIDWTILGKFSESLNGNAYSKVSYDFSPDFSKELRSDFIPDFIRYSNCIYIQMAKLSSKYDTRTCGRFCHKDELKLFRIQKLNRCIVHPWKSIKLNTIAYKHRSNICTATFILFMKTLDISMLFQVLFVLVLNICTYIPIYSFKNKCELSRSYNLLNC